MVALSPVIFIFSELFLMNTVINPSDSLPYLVGEALCFGVAPILLVLGIVVCAVAPSQKKRITAQQSDATSSMKEAPPVVNPALMLVRRAIGLILVFVLFALPLIQGNWQFFLALFVVFPLPLITYPCLAAVLYLLFSKRPRRIDALVIIACGVMLLSAAVAPPLAIISALILVVVLILVAITVRAKSFRNKKET